LNQHQKGAALLRYVGWQIGARIVPGAVAVPFVAGTRLLVRPGMDAATGAVYAGFQEFEDMAFVLHVLRPEDLFVDVGANIGTYSIIAAGACGASVIAVEPIAVAYKHLLDNVRLNNLESRIVVRKIGLGDKPGELSFTSDSDSVNHVVSDAEGKGAGTVTVAIDTMDHMLEKASPRVIKVDVEGYETAVLNGASDTLDSQDLVALVLELNGSGERYGFDEAALHEKLKLRGFRPYRYEPFARTLVALQDRNTRAGNTIYVRNYDFVADRLKKAELRPINGMHL
jgi:FkbM family methyltransferase